MSVNNLAAVGHWSATYKKPNLSQKRKRYAIEEEIEVLLRPTMAVGINDWDDDRWYLVFVGDSP